MIKIGNTNKFPLIAQDIYGVSSEDIVKKLEPKYPLWYNTAIKKWIHSKNFGDKKDFEYGSNSGVTCIFDFDKDIVTIECYGHDGMTSLIFTEDDITKHPKNLDDEVVNYTFQMINYLVDNQYIDLRQKDLKKKQ